MELLSKSFTSYVSTQWLKTPITSDGRCPSEMMKEGELEKVYSLLQKEIDSKKCK